MSFLQVFIAAPDIDLLKSSVRKSDWLALGKHYKCEVDASMKKDHIKANVIEYLVEENIVPEIALTLIAGHKSKAELEIQKELKLKQMELEYNERMKKMELECELEMKRIEAGLSRSGRSGPNEQVDVMKYVKLLPVFNEEEVDIFFREFEKLAGSLHIDEDYWALLVRSVFTGRAQEVSSTLSVEDSGDYTVLKSTILKAYDKVPEFYRQKFRNARKDDCMTYGEFANLKERYFDNWCRAVKISGDFEKLRELVLVEEFKRCIDPTLRVFLDEKEVPSLNGIASLADTYSLTHKTFNRVKNVQAVDCQTKQIPKSDTAKVVPTKKDKIGSSQFVCYYSAKLKRYQLNYATIEKEALALVMALQHFEVYLSASQYPIHVFTDHNPLVFIESFKNKNQRLMRWSFLLQPYNFVIQHIKGRDNVLADCLSRAFHSD
ncbi:hypothetical protein Pmani_022749 [Petrolisthes manimaculis]|uniref:Reverse transcriptase RNase H-like domain-containing protein n=1 Tax=Petrolisthes manimaculis TaxID=1843537 RepID=A0AAE1PDR1_9EUCA|nr:hypothetical protein Pmani_022749 [Petrolisthes manimaculis]